MSLFYKTLEEHRQLLEVRGFNEKSLGAPEKQGWLSREFQAHLSRTINEAHTTGETTVFDLKTMGFFNDSKDIVTFMLNYGYSPDKMELKINHLSADFEGKKRIYPLGKNEDLPSSAEVYNEFALAKKAQRIKNNPVAALAYIVEEQTLFLNRFGYYKTRFPNPPNNITEELKLRVEDLIKKPATGVEEIKIERALHLSDHHSVNCLFHYRYDPAKMAVRLDSITGKTMSVEKSFPVNRELPLLTLHDICHELNKIVRLNKASKMVQQNSQKMGGRKI